MAGRPKIAEALAVERRQAVDSLALDPDRYRDAVLAGAGASPAEETENSSELQQKLGEHAWAGAKGRTAEPVPVGHCMRKGVV